MVAVPEPLSPEEVKVSVPVTAQVGGLLGLETLLLVSVQELSVTVPIYPVLVAPVIVEVAVPPAAIAAGEVADSE
jgi:hypothetical protein